MIEPVHRQLYPRKIQWETKNDSISNDSSIDSVSTNPDWLPLKAKLELCNMEKFFFYWFDNQADKSWENIKADKEKFNKLGIAKDKFFVCRARKLIKNMMIYGNNNGFPCEIKERPKNDELLVKWRKDLKHTSSFINGMLLDELNREGLLSPKKKDSRIKLQKYCDVVNKLVQKKYTTTPV